MVGVHSWGKYGTLGGVKAAVEFQHVLMDDEQLKESSSISLSCTAPRFVHHILVPRRLAAPPPHRPDLDVTGFRMDSLPKPRPAGISPHSRGGRASIPSALRSTFQLMKPLLSPLEAPASSIIIICMYFLSLSLYIYIYIHTYIHTYTYNQSTNSANSNNTTQ